MTTDELPMGWFAIGITTVRSSRVTRLSGTRADPVLLSIDPLQAIAPAVRVRLRDVWVKVMEADRFDPRR